MKLSNILKKQQGAALIVSLVILIAMTMLAVTSMRGTSTELAMAGNLRESGLAFQAAEAGLRFAELQVENAVNAGAVANQISQLSADPDYLHANSWKSGGSAQTATIDLSSVGVAANPQYIIKYVDENSFDRLKLINTGSGYGAPPKGPTVAIFRITSRASGQSGSSFRTVQSHYGK